MKWISNAIRIATAASVIFIAAPDRETSRPTPTTINAAIAISGKYVRRSVPTSVGSGRIEDGLRTLVVGGTALRQTFTCTYSVNDDGTGHADCVVTGAPDEHFDFVIVSKGDEAYFTAVPATVPGAGTTTIRGLVKSQR